MKINQMSNDDLIELYEQLYEVTPIMNEMVDEAHIEDAIWDEMHVTVSAYINDDEVEIIPDSYQELADYWEVEVMGNDFNDKLEELEKKWSAKVGRKPKQKEL